MNLPELPKPTFEWPSLCKYNESEVQAYGEACYQEGYEDGFDHGWDAAKGTRNVRTLDRKVPGVATKGGNSTPTLAEAPLKLVNKVAVLPVVTTIPIPVERVLQAAIDAEPVYIMVIGEDADGSLYFASSESDGGEALWWMEKAKLALMRITE